MNRKLRSTIVLCTIFITVFAPLLARDYVLAACGLPPQQELAAAKSRMGDEKSVEFDIEKYPALGTVSIEIFIRAKEVKLVLPYLATEDNLDQFQGGPIGMEARYSTALEMPGVFGLGDGREADSNFNPEKTRAFYVLNFATGKGYLVVNQSMLKFRPLPFATVTNKTFGAKPAYRQWGGAQNWFWADWIDGNTYRIRSHFTEGVPSAGIAPGIDNEILINKDTQVATLNGDEFPTIGVHQPTACRTLLVRPEANPMGLYNNEDPYSLGVGPQNKKPGPPASYGTSGTNQLPRADYSWKRYPGAGNKVGFDGTLSKDPDGTIAKYEWQIDNVVVASGPKPVISLGNVTSKDVLLRVFDNRGDISTMSKVLSLPNRAPVVLGGAPADNETVGSNTPYIAGIAKDDDGENVQYSYRVTGPYVDVTSGWLSSGWTVPSSKLDPGTEYTLTTSAKDPHGATASRQTKFRVAMLPTASDIVSTPSGMGYWQVATDGGVFAYGDAGFYGSLPGLGVQTSNIMGMARTPSGKGYWLVGSDGGVFAFGDAPFAGSLPGLNIHVNNIVGMAPTRTGNGYWLTGSDGGVFAFGDAGFYGSMGGQPLNKPVEAISPTPTGGGYWLAAQDGGVFAFGDAQFFGSMGGRPLNAPITDLDVTPDGKGYWLTAQDGGVFAFGNAQFFGSMAGQPLNGHITGMSRSLDGGGYWLTGCDGGIFAFGNAVFYGSQPRYGCRGF